MAPNRKNKTDQIVFEQVKAQENQSLSSRLEDNVTFEENVIKVEVYETEREITRVIQDYVQDLSAKLI
jgi:hypothetical protein